MEGPEFEQKTAESVEVVLKMASLCLERHNDPIQAMNFMWERLQHAADAKPPIDFLLTLSVLAVRTALNNQLPPEPS